MLLLCEVLQSFGQTTVTFDFTKDELIKSIGAKTTLNSKDDIYSSFKFNNVTFTNAVFKDDGTNYWMKIPRESAKTLPMKITVPTGMKIISVKFHILSGYNTTSLNSLEVGVHRLSPKSSTDYAEWSGNENSINVISVSSHVIIGNIDVTYGPITIDGSNEDANNHVIDDCNGYIADVVLNRSFKGNNGWYTLCLPFDLTMDQMNTAFGDGVDVETMSGVVKGNDGMLSVNFSKLTTGTSAGTPYLIKPSVSVDNPKFTDVTINAKTPTKQTIEGCDFIGIYDPTTILADSKNHFLNSEGSYLVSSTGIGKLKATRAYFVLPTSNSAKVMTGQEATTGIESIKTSTNEDVIYNINGQRVNSNLVSGIYIINGKKVAIRK